MTDEREYKEVVAKKRKAIKDGDYDLATALATYCYNHNDYKEGLKVFNLVKRPLTDKESICKAVGYFESGQFEEGAKASLKPAQNGDPLAQYYMGTYYDYHPGDQKSGKDAFRWYKIAADNNYAPAMTRMAEMLEYGEGIEVDKALAMSYYEKAAELGDSDAMYVMAKHYLSEDHLDRDKGLKYMELAADAKQSEAMFEVGYHNLEDNFNEAFSMLKDAAELGSERAAYVCGLMYLNGDHVDKDIDEAMGYFGMYDTVRSYIMTAYINMMEDTEYYDPVRTATMLTLAEMIKDKANEDKDHKELYYGIPTGHDLDFEKVRVDLMGRMSKAIEEMQKNM